MKNNPILSICIPTYNRAEYLDQTLYSITNQKIFQETNDIEIVISDNCSEDNTREICERFTKKYGDKIRYYRNNENIRDKNYEKVLSYGNGRFLKLNNDTLIHYRNTLERIIEAVNRASAHNDVIFFSNGAIKEGSQFYCNNLDEFVKEVSFYSTWIACFGIWKHDFDSLKDFNRSAKLQLVQVDVLFRLISAPERKVLVENSRIFEPAELVTKGGYNLYQVFVTNYLGILEEYRALNKITRRTLFNEKSKLLIYFIIPWSLNIMKNPKKFRFDKDGALIIVLKEYLFHPILYFGFIYFLLKLILKFFKVLVIK